MKGVCISLILYCVFTFSLIACQRTSTALPRINVVNDLLNITNDESAIELLKPMIHTANLTNSTFTIEQTNKPSSASSMNKVSFPQSTLEHTIQRGWLNASHLLMASHFSQRSQEFDLPSEFQRIRKSLKLTQLPVFSNLTHLLPAYSSALTQIEPCFLWAQNMTHILMKVKFTPKIDVPGYSEIHGVNVTITLPELFISAYAFSGESPVRFELKIKTYKFMNAFGSKWSSTEQGTLFLEILKSPSPYVWRNIHSDLHYNPPNQHIWWEIYRQNKDHFEAGFSLLEDTEMKRELKEDEKFIRQEKQIADKKLIRETLAQNEVQLPQQFRDLMYCTELPNNKGNFIPDAFDWLFWQL